MKRLAAICMLIMLSIGLFSGPIWAVPAPLITLDGGPLSFDVPPLSENNTILVPVRTIFEALGASVIWDEATQTVTAVKSGTEIKLVVGQNTAYKNGTPVVLNTPPQVVNDRLLVPLRFVSEALGVQVTWNAEKQEIALLSPLPVGSNPTTPPSQEPVTAINQNQEQPKPPDITEPQLVSDKMLLIYQYIKSYWMMILLGLGSLTIILWGAPSLKRSGKRKSEPQEIPDDVEAQYRQGLALIQQGKWAEANLALGSLSLDEYKDSEPLANYAAAHQQHLESNAPGTADPYWAAYMADFYCRKIPELYEGCCQDEIRAFRTVCQDNLALWQKDPVALKKHERAEEERRQADLDRKLSETP